ncbi:uncharacterized protein Dsimw501_GD27419 [Drosophila simulans]|nr:uncharacterized protein Dsimw501_GD27419 [Drosophila simulans]
MSEKMEITPITGMYEVSQKSEEKVIAPMLKAEMSENMENTPVPEMYEVSQKYEEKVIAPMLKAEMSENMENTPVPGMYEVSQKYEENAIAPMFKAEMSEDMEITPVTGMYEVSQKYEKNAFAPMSEICAKDYTISPMDGIAQEENTFVSIPDGITRLKDILDTQTIYVQGNETVAPINEISQMINTVSPLVEISQNEQNINGRTENGNPKILIDTSTISMNDTPTVNPVGTTNVVVMVEEPNTIIELVDYYVPPASLNNNNNTIPPFFPITVPLHPESSHEPTPKPPTKGKRGRKPGPKPKPRATKRRRPPTPPPLPPVPNFLAHVINPLENEIYPKVVVQPAHQPWVLPSHCNDGVPNPPPSKVAVKEVPNTTTTSRRVLISAHLREKLRLFGPDVIISVIDNAVSPYFKAVKKEPDGSQHQIFFTAPQLLSFTAAHFGNWPQMVPIQMLMMKPTPAMLSHYFPGPMGQALVKKWLTDQQPLNLQPSLPFKMPIGKPPQATKAFPRPNATYLHPGKPQVSKHFAAPAPPAVPAPRPADTVAPPPVDAPTAYSADDPAPESTPGSAPESTPGPAPESTPGPAPESTPDPAPTPHPEHTPDPPHTTTLAPTPAPPVDPTPAPPAACNPTDPFDESMFPPIILPAILKRSSQERLRKSIMAKRIKAMKEAQEAQEAAASAAAEKAKRSLNKEMPEEEF